MNVGCQTKNRIEQNKTEQNKTEKMSEKYRMIYNGNNIKITETMQFLMKLKKHKQTEPNEKEMKIVAVC